mmetsp:Transcript_82465/g.156931  ORF Transcript_82465/g.156931 Transcript_82465/m.156931 type:complete len:197 (-) Transcript_82465:95-685(-)
MFGSGSLDAFSAWVQREKARNEDALPTRLVDRQILAWISGVHALACRQQRSSCRRSRRSNRGRCRDQRATSTMLRPGLPRGVRDIIYTFVGDQTGGAVTALSLRRRAEAVRFRDFWIGLSPMLEKAADQGMMSYQIHQNIEQLPFGRSWMQEPEAMQWIRACLEARGFAVELCKLYHTAYAGYQGCSFFELKISWA